MGHAGDDEHEPGDSQAIDKLLAKIAEQEAILKEQQESLNAEDQSDSEPVNKDQETSSDGSVPITPASEAFDHVGHHDAEDDTVKVVRPASDVDELARLKRELDAAKNQIARMDEELVQTRITRQSVDQVLRSPSDASVRAPQVSDRTISQLQETFNASARASAERAQASMERVNSWGAYDDNHSEMSDALPAPHFNRGVGIWGNPPRPNYQGDMMPSPNMQAAPHPPSNWPQDPTRGPYARGPGNNFPPPPPPMSPHLPRPILAPQPQGFVPDLRTMNQMSMFTYEQQQAYRRSQAGQIGRFNGGGPYNQRNLGWGGYPNNLGMSGMSESPSPIPQPIPAGSMYPGSAGYQPTPIGTPLSPTAPEFRFPSGRPNQCNMPVSVNPSGSRLTQLTAAATVVPGADLRLCLRATQLPAHAGAQRERQLELHCRQDHLQQRSAGFHLFATEAQGRHESAEIRDHRGHCSEGLSVDDQSLRELFGAAMLRARHPGSDCRNRQGDSR